MPHLITREHTGFGPSGSATPVCSCGWRGYPVYETDGAMMQWLSAQEQVHSNAVFLEEHAAFYEEHCITKVSL